MKSILKSMAQGPQLSTWRWRRWRDGQKRELQSNLGTHLLPRPMQTAENIPVVGAHLRREGRVGVLGGGQIKWVWGDGMGRGEGVTFAGERIVNYDRRWCCVVYGILHVFWKYIRQQVASLQVTITVLDALQPSYTNIRVWSSFPCYSWNNSTAFLRKFVCRHYIFSLLEL